MQKITNLRKFGLNWSSKLQEKNTLVAQICVLSVAEKGFRPNSNEKLPLFPNLCTSEGAISHIVFYYQQLAIVCYQLTLLVSSAFNV